MTQAVLEIDHVNGVCLRRFRNGAVRVVGSVNQDGYLHTMIGSKSVLIHRLIWQQVNGPIAEGLQIDHINGVRTDNRISNLRLVTNTQNSQNRVRAHQNSRSGFKGVTWHKLTMKWCATIGHSWKRYHLGLFASVQEAEAAYKGAAAILHTHNPSAPPKKNPAEAGQRGQQPPGGETTTREHGVSV